MCRADELSRRYCYSSFPGRRRNALWEPLRLKAFSYCVRRVSAPFPWGGRPTVSEVSRLAPDACHFASPRFEFTCGVFRKSVTLSACNEIGGKSQPGEPRLPN
ncbi:Hypothetical protein NTJ_05739 [Nesidiocoris tenuis]|uniref:Uncharacterized protein n=1 Tax=Nesidiocoris tenuis TaxID=355587 RepID=A0ABN7ALL4_9HEMI|nr:Hypothetical protein NTJ_05739 [Nesidiocoris tenuis]